jgi:hypothetical protein
MLGVFLLLAAGTVCALIGFGGELLWNLVKKVEECKIVKQT